jgi:hypothetical protein
MSILPYSRHALLLAAVSAVFACGSDDPAGPVSVVGSYSATRFEVVQNGVTANLLALGGRVDATFATGGTVQAHLVVPGAGEQGSTLDVTFAGTWTQSGSSVDITPSPGSDSFLSDVPLTIGSNGALTGEGTFSGATVRLTLSKTGN